MKNSLLAGFYHDLSNADYHNDSAVGASTLKTILYKSPAHIGVRTESAAFDFGTAFHYAILEPEKFEKAVKCGPDNRRGNAWKDLQAACEAQGQLLLVEGEYNECLAARDAVHKNSYVRRLLDLKYKSESSIFWDDDIYGVRCKCRPDLITVDGRFIDLKTTQSANANDFARSIANYGYHIQQAHYQEGCKQISRGQNEFLSLAVEKTAPYASAVYQLDDESIAQGTNDWNRAMSIYATCKEKNEFKGYPEEIQKIRLPSWALEFPSDDGEAKLSA